MGMSSPRNPVRLRCSWGEFLLPSLVLLAIVLTASTSFAVLPPPIQAPFVHAGDPDDPGGGLYQAGAEGPRPATVVQPTEIEGRPGCPAAQMPAGSGRSRSLPGYEAPAAEVSTDTYGALSWLFRVWLYSSHI